jgi:hypothetical protein
VLADAETNKAQKLRRTEVGRIVMFEDGFEDGFEDIAGMGEPSKSH